MFKLLNADFEKEYNDCAEGIIYPREFNKVFYFFLKIFQVLDGSIPKYTYIVKVILLLSASTAIVLMSISFYHGLETFDIPFLTEAGTYFIILYYKFLIIYCAKLHCPEYHSLQRAIEEDFLFVCTKGEKYRKRFFNHQIETRRIYKLLLIFNAGIVIGMNLFTIMCLLFHILTHEPGEGERPLLFPLWFFETDLSKTPVYEIAFVYSNFVVLAYAFNYTFMIGTQIVWMRQICCKADLIMWQIEDVMAGIRPTNYKTEKEIFDNLIRQRMREIIQQHNSMDILITKFAKTHTKFYMSEQLLSAPVVCLTAYSAAEKLDEGEFNAILIILLIAVVILLYIPSYLCTLLSIKVSSIAFACWDIPFWDASPVIRPYLTLIINKTLQPLPLKVPGLEEFSVKTFSNKMASAYSYFNMLRQTKKN